MIEWLAGALALVLVLVVTAWAWYRRQAGGHHNDSYSANFGGDYFRGLNYLLNEQPDKALEVFLQLAEVNPDTIETHLALGNLFRRRGEVERAIRCHENIIAKASISPAERQHALLELAEDYRRAGLLDRAEYLYHQLAQQSDGHLIALNRLLDIYQQEQDWQQAIAISTRMQAAGQHELSPLIAHFHCEQAAQALTDNRLEAARQALDAAQEQHPDSLRRRLMHAHLLLREGHPRQAVDALHSALQQHPNLLPVALNTLVEAHTAADATAELQTELHHWLSTRQDVSATMALTQLYRNHRQEDKISDLLLDQLLKRPNVRLLRELLALLDPAGYQQLAGRLRPVIEQLCDDLLKEEVTFRCRHCGFGGHSHHWQCPSCRHWDTTWPVRGVTGK